MQHGIRKEPQLFKGLFLVYLVLSSGKVAHDFEGRSGDSPHPEIDILHVALLGQQQDVDLPFLIADLQLANALLLHLLTLDHLVLFSLEEEALFVVAENRLVFFRLFPDLLLRLSIQPLLYFAADVEHLPVLHYLLGQLAEELLLRGRPEVPLFLALEGIDGLIRALVHVLLADLIDYFEEDSVGEFGLEDVGKVAVDEVAKDLEGFFGVVGEELVALDGDAVGEEAHGQALCLSELVHPVLLVDLSAQALRVKTGVELLCPALDSTDVDLAGQSILIVGLSYILLDPVGLELAFDLAAHPFQAVPLEIGLHLLHLFLQLFVLSLNALQLLVLLAGIVPAALQEGVLGF